MGTTPEDERVIRDALIRAIKELGEIAACVVKEDTREDHWKNELGDLCGTAILPMLTAANTTFDEACIVGLNRKHAKLMEAGLKSDTPDYESEGTMDADQQCKYLMCQNAGRTVECHADLPDECPKSSHKFGVTPCCWDVNERIET